MISKSEYLGGLGKYHNKIKVSLSGGTTYNLPTASESVKGGVKIGDGLSMTGDTHDFKLKLHRLYRRGTFNGRFERFSSGSVNR